MGELRTFGRDLLMNVVLASPLVPSFVRWRAMRAVGMQVESSTIMPRCFFGGRQVSIGRGTFINYGRFIDNADQVHIGKDCAFGMEAMIITGSHHIGPQGRRRGASRTAPVVVEDGAWIGARAIIQPGVVVGRGCVVAAGALVTKDCMPNGLYAGVPARRIRELD